MVEYLGVFIFFLLSALLSGAFLGLTSILGPKRRNPVKSEPFECGEEPISLPGGRYSIHFYGIAMLFILLDVELVFLFPWAVLLKELGARGFLGMLFFLTVVVLGFLYAWRKGALDLD